MKIHFSIDSPATPEAIAAARTSVEKAVKYRFLIALLTLALAGYLAFSFWDIAGSIAKHFFGDNNLPFILGGLTQVCCCILIFVGTVSIVGGVMSTYNLTYALTSPLEPWKAVRALELAKQFPELEDYRRAVVSSRTFLEGDYEAMNEYAEEARAKYAARQVIDQHAAALATLNAPPLGPKS